MNSKRWIYLFIALCVFLSIFFTVLKSIKDENSKTLEDIVLQSKLNTLIFEYSNKTQNIISNPFDFTFPIISEDGIIINDKNIYKIKNDNEIEKVSSMEGLIYSYKNENNYIVKSSDRYLKVKTDNSESSYYLFNSQYNFLNCRQVVQYKNKVLCLSTNLGIISELQNNAAASRYSQFDKQGYTIAGLYNLGENLLMIYQSINIGVEIKSPDGKQPSVSILNINGNEVELTDKFVYQVSYRDNKYLVSTITESNLNNKIENFEIYSLSPQGELKLISQNSAGTFLY